MRGLIAATLGCWSLWRMPSDFHALIRPLPAALKPYVRQFRYALHDLSPRSDAEIKGDVLTRLVQLAQRWIVSDQPLAHLEVINPLSS